MYRYMITAINVRDKDVIDFSLSQKDKSKDMKVFRKYESKCYM